MALAAARPILCQLKSDQPAIEQPAGISALPIQKVKISGVSTSPAGSTADYGRIVLQPRLCTLRSYGSDADRSVGGVMIKSRTTTTTADGRDGDHEDADRMTSPFFATLSEYIESSKNSQDFEIISGRLAMIVFAGTVTMEMVTGNSLFRKMDVQGIAEAAGVCLGAVTCAAIFAWFSSARNRVGRIFAVKCNTLIDSLIDQIVDGLFYDSELSDWSDEL